MITNTTILHTIDVKYKDGKYGNFYEITMITEEGKVAVTYIDESFENWWKWAYICKQPDNGYIITNCKHKTTRISRDCQWLRTSISTKFCRSPLGI